LKHIGLIPGSNIERVSSWYLTQPVGLEDPEWFVNGVILLTTDLSAEGLLSRLLEIEKNMGRERTVKWGPRVIDLDLLLYDATIINAPFLTLPHPFLVKRKFVLEPLAEIAPETVHPILGRTMEQLNRELSGEGQAVIPLRD
jgi:2-amino-4-hydroxy-6-hydroxymethyldihydropteridine diphosphokinase